jgi:tripartite motif-containing protein 71
VKIFLILGLVGMVMLTGAVSNFNIFSSNKAYAGRFGEPWGIAVDSSGYVFVTDNSPRIQKFNNNGKFIRQWDTSDQSNDIAVDKSGNVFVADKSKNSILKFTNTGKFIRQWNSYGPGDYFTTPALGGIAVDKSGNVFVADIHNQRIKKYTNTGTFLGEWGSFGSGNGQFHNPSDIAVDSKGYVYVADDQPGGADDGNNDRIQKFSNNGTFIREWGSTGSGDGQFIIPEGIGIDSRGHVFVLDRGNSSIQKFTNTGDFIRKWGGVGSSEGIAVDKSGNVFVANTHGHNILKFTNTGTFITKWK